MRTGSRGFRRGGKGQRKGEEANRRGGGGEEGRGRAHSCGCCQPRCPLLRREGGGEGGQRRGKKIQGEKAGRSNVMKG